MISHSAKVIPLRPTEAQIQSAVIAHWRCFGLPNTLVACIPMANSWGQPGLTRGLFDLIVFAPGLPVGFIELKANRGAISAHQVAHAELLKTLGIPHAITFGRDEPIEQLEAWNVLRSRA